MFDAVERKELHLLIGFTKDVRLPEEAGQLCCVHDTVKRQWQHLNFFEHACYLHCGVPRIKTSTGKVVNVEIPRTKANGGFALLFEALALVILEREMPVNYMLN